MEGYVYLIGSPIFGWYKIGKSKTPEIRIKNLGILLPFKIQVIGVWKAKNHHLLEKSLHEIHSSSAINGEWFEFSRTKVIDIFDSLPKEARIYPVENNEHFFDRFSNVEKDLRKTQRVIGVRVQKLRGNFTDEEREAKRIASMIEQKKKKESKLLNAK